jgi:hypothetical protein
MPLKRWVFTAGRKMAISKARKQAWKTGMTTARKKSINKARAAAKRMRQPGGVTLEHGAKLDLFTTGGGSTKFQTVSKPCRPRPK